MTRLWTLTALGLLLGLPGSGVADSNPDVAVGLWEDKTEDTIGETGEWSNKVELADLNGDGKVDILFANGGNYDEPGDPEYTRIFLNQGAGQPFKEVTETIFGEDKFITRAVKVRDVNADGHPDMLLATTYQSQSRLYLGDGRGGFKDATATHLPELKASFGDADFADVDGDGDLDLLLADWGPGNPMENEGGPARLWLNDGQGKFTDVTGQQMPAVKIKFSWELDAVDVDNDYDLDLMISSKMSKGSFLFENDGRGNFKDVTEGRLPQYENNYDFEAMDLNNDGYLDVLTINDGEHVNTDDPYARRNHVFFNDGKGGFLNVTRRVLDERDNPGVDDNLSVFLDFDSDGDADALVGSLSGLDRLLINDGNGHFRLSDNLFNTFTGHPTHGTLGMAVADLNGDHKLDVVESQGEVEGNIDERVYFGKNIAPDTAAPKICLVEKVELKPGETVKVRARVHDNKSPTMPHDWQSVSLNWQGGGQRGEVPMKWYGEYLWRAEAKVSGKDWRYQVCATDAAGNRACSLMQ